MTFELVRASLSHGGQRSRVTLARAEGLGTRLATALLLSDGCPPHPSRASDGLCLRLVCHTSAYMSNVSCAGAIFATQEVVARYVCEGSDVYMCLYDLQKAFDSVEYCVLLQRLFSVGVNGRIWRLLRSWYDNVRCRVCMNGNLSSDFIVQRGVRQGSVLSPTLFLLVMNPFLIKLQLSLWPRAFH